MPITGNALFGQSGGPTQVINQTLIAGVQAALASDQVQHVYGAVHGIRGILEGGVCDLGQEDPGNLELVAQTPSSGLLSVRMKPDEATCQRILKRLEQLGVRFFFYIGGNDTAETTHIINELAKRDGYELACIHLPKTIDNDLRVTDHCPGYGSAARFVASAFIGDNLDNRALGGIKINIVMGRDAGWLTAASVLARGFPDDGPHLVYLPEVDFDLQRFCADVTEIYRRQGRCVVAVSEGIHGPGGSSIIDLGETDSHGNKQLSGSGALGDSLASTLKAHLAQALPDQTVRLRADTLGYIQRQFPGFASEVDASEARLVGQVGVEHALLGHDGSIAIRRLGDQPYHVEAFLTPLETVAKVTKPVPREWINADGNDIVTEHFVPYALPLTGGLPPVGRLAMHFIDLPAID